MKTSYMPPGPCLPPSPGRAGQTQELVQCKTEFFQNDCFSAAFHSLLQSMFFHKIKLNLFHYWSRFVFWSIACRLFQRSVRQSIQSSETSSQLFKLCNSVWYIPNVKLIRGTVLDMHSTYRQGFLIVIGLCDLDLFYSQWVKTNKVSGMRIRIPA